MHRKLIAALGAAAAVVAAAGFCAFQNNALQVTRHTVCSPRLPAAFDGLRIVHLSDLHNKSFGADNERLVSAVSALAPDMIIASGDMIDSRHTDADVTLALLTRLSGVAPVYYSFGNHESRLSDLASLSADITAAGARLLHNESVLIGRDDARLAIAGIADLDFFMSPDEYDSAVFNLCHRAGGDFTLLIAHHPERLEMYSLAGADVVFSGHAHGGLFRLPFGDVGLIAPDQGFFPALTSGLHRQGQTALVISRGLGPAIVPLRIFNRPEIVLVQLCASDAE